MSIAAAETNGKDVILELIKCPICLEIYTDPRKLKINIQLKIVLKIH